MENKNYLGLFSIVPLLFGCSPTSSSYSLDIEDIELRVGEKVAIKASFSDEVERPITYSYESQAIRIEEGYVEALSAPATVRVKAMSGDVSTDFTVTTLEIEKPRLFYEDIVCWLGYPSVDFYGEYADEADQTLPVEYHYDETMISISGNTITPLKEGVTTVTATMDGFETSFEVEVKSVSKEGILWDYSAYAGYAMQLAVKYQNEGRADRSTVFLGDSFFDVREFWTDFYETYEGKDAFCFGIGGATTFDWETFIDMVLGMMAPKNIVINLGTNNIYDDNQDIGETVEELERLFTLIHGYFPKTMIYYFAITKRNYDPIRQTYTSEVNKAISSYCGQRDYLTFLNTEPLLTPNKLKDGIHPKLEEYQIFVDALVEAGIEIEDR